MAEPITDANVGAAMSGGDLTTEEHEVMLSEDVADVDERVVPKERVQLETVKETDEVAVGAAPQLSECITAAVEASVDNVIVDPADLTFMDSWPHRHHHLDRGEVPSPHLVPHICAEFPTVALADGLQARLPGTACMCSPSCRGSCAASPRPDMSSRSSTTGCATATSAASPPPLMQREVGHDQTQPVSA